MKILHIVPTYIPAYRYGGPIYSVHGLCKALVKLGHEVHVYTTNVNGDQDSAVPIGEAVDVEGVKVWYFPSHFLRRIYYSPQLEKHLRKTIQGFDLIHLHSVFLRPTLVGARYAQKYQIPYFLTPRGMLVKDLINRKSTLIKNFWIQLFEKRTIAQASAIHLTSQAELSALKDFNFVLPPCVVIANGVDMPQTPATATIDPFPPPHSDWKMILFLSRINWKKGLDRLIPAMQFIDNAYLRIVGNDEENYLPTLHALTKQYQVEDKVFFHNAIYGETKSKLYQAADIFVLPSYSENFGNVILEALSYGCPVITTPEVGLANFIQEYDLGIVVDGSVQSIASSIQFLLEKTEKRLSIQARSPQIVDAHFSWQKIGEDMIRFYQEHYRC